MDSERMDASPIQQSVDQIAHLNSKIANFWSAAGGWAPISAAGLLGRSRLDWQVSLSESLRLWIRHPANCITPGELILAWTSLGALVEGTLKLLLSVYYEDYRVDTEHLKLAGAYNEKRQSIIEPDTLTIEKIKKYCRCRSLLSATDDNLVDLVQARRNAIHAFKDREIGDGIEFQMAIRSYLDLLRNVNDLLPYPDETYTPDY